MKRKIAWMSLLLVAAMLLGAGCQDPAATTLPASSSTVTTAPTQAPTTVTTAPTQAPTVPTTQPTTAPATQPALKKAPDITVQDAEGNEYKLSDFLGTPVVLNFWASWCGPCLMEMPRFEDKYQEWGDQIQFLMVNVTASDTVEDAQAVLEKYGFLFPVFYDPTGEAANTYNVSSIPITFFITREGEIKYSYLGSMSKKDLQRGIDVLLVN